MTDLNSSLMSRGFAAGRLARAGANVGTVVAAVATLTIASAVALAAQEAPAPHAPRFHIATYAGAAIPTGSLSDSFDNSFLLGAQGTYALGSHFELLGDFDWTRPTTSLASSDAHADVYQTDVGVEFGAARGNTRRWAMRPFADLGAGFRRYDYSSSELNDSGRPAGFAAVGTEVAFGRSAIRLAARDNVLSYESPLPDATHSTKNDLGLTLGVGFHP